MKLLYLIGILCCILFRIAQGGNQRPKVLLSDVQTLTLQKGQRTQARRVSAIPQIKCIGGSAKCAFEPDVVQCYNRGSNGVDIQWECTAEMPKQYKFGKLSVSCEGYDYPDDPYILAGSCGLEYNLESTDKRFYDTRQAPASRNSLWPFLLKLAMIVGVFLAIRSFLAGNRPGGVRPMSTGPDFRPPGGGGGGWFSHFFPGGNGGLGGFGQWFGGLPGQGDARRRTQPPPPGFRNDYGNTGFDNADCHTTQQNTGTGGATNFFTGAALGALGGYAFGARNRTHQTHQTHDTGNTGWFGGGTTTTTHQRGSSPSSGGSHTSTGYGGTSRR